ncbi:MAG TPA: four helix bundle protein [Lacunisphaera sp.]|nr:four helix bundle protein [Lacunisphaera sp.]
MGAEGYRELRVWHAARDLAGDMYQATDTGSLARDFGRQDQMRRAAASIPSNIAEGDERGTNKDSVRFWHMAKGSLPELRTRLEIARDVGSLNPETHQTLEGRCAELGRMLGALIKARTTTHTP